MSEVNLSLDAFGRSPLAYEPLSPEHEAQIVAQLAEVQARDEPPRIKWAKSVLARPVLQVMLRMHPQLAMTAIPVDPMSRGRIQLAERIESKVRDLARDMHYSGKCQDAADIYAALEAVGVTTELDMSTHSLRVVVVPWYDSRMMRR